MDKKNLQNISPNPATGLVYVENSKPGNILRADIEGIKIRDYAVMCVETDKHTPTSPKSLLRFQHL